MRKIEKKGPMVWISKFTDTRNPHIISDNLAKAESLVVLVQEKLASLKFRPHVVTFMDISKAKFI